MAEATPPGGVLVALPGTLLPPTIFEGVALPDGWRWHGVDWLGGPGDGELTRAAAELCRHWPPSDTAPALLVGHSAGGVIALQLAAALGARLAGLVLIDTGASAINHGDPQLPQRLRAQWGEAFIDRFLHRCVGEAALERHGERLRHYARTCNPERAYRAMCSLRRLDLTARLSEIRCPTLVVHGDRDPARTWQHAMALAEGITGARLARLDAGHTPMLECPGRLSQALGDFLTSRNTGRH
ncbi:alpha/beta fold hydrolase [Salinicola endophyticus]|uniref:alpha/beta fold hydrolase n=1 Tax=Salinicola endophyticus TaxID=1949083 RepID=UPI002499F246|nr:alpha/beta hydrolase [Salinicola endophyticus]